MLKETLEKYQGHERQAQVGWLEASADSFPPQRAHQILLKSTSPGFASVSPESHNAMTSLGNEYMVASR
jgi:hypothetical protein